MHEYVATSVKRHRVVWTLASISFAASFGLGALFHKLKLPSYIAPPTGAAFFTLVFVLYNQYLWRLSIVSPIPNLRGTWTGTIDIRKNENPQTDRPKDDEAEATEKPDEVEKLDCTVRIKQTWAAISIEFETEKSKSNSVTAAVAPSGHDSLHYEYDVTVEDGKTLEKGSEKTEGRHFGTAHLKPVKGSWRSLSGRYYNDRDFPRWGHYEIKWVSRRTKE